MDELPEYISPDYVDVHDNALLKIGAIEVVGPGDHAGRDHHNNARGDGG